MTGDDMIVVVIQGGIKGTRMTGGVGIAGTIGDLIGDMTGGIGEMTDGIGNMIGVGIEEVGGDKIEELAVSVFF